MPESETITTGGAQLSTSNRRSLGLMTPRLLLLSEVISHSLRACSKFPIAKCAYL